MTSQRTTLRSLLLMSWMPLVSCQDQTIDDYYKEIESFGYIPFKTPLQHGATGTIIGGKPDSIQLMSHPYVCFPPEIGGAPSGIRFRSDASLPYHNKKVTVDISLHADFLDAMKVGSPSLRAGTKISDVRYVEVEYRGAHVEYMDSILLSDFYQEHLSEKCKNYLDRFGVIVQALAVDSMVFKFYSKSNQRYYVDVNNIEEFLDISGDVAWSVEKNEGIVIESTKYIGYVLGKLTRQEGDVFAWRASKIGNNEYNWQKLDNLPKGQYQMQGKALDYLNIPAGPVTFYDNL